MWPSCQALDRLCAIVGAYAIQQAHDRVATCRQVLWCIPHADATRIFAQRYVPHVMQLILDTPMVAYPCQELRRLGLCEGETGDAMHDFDGRVALAGDFTAEAEPLFQTRPLVKYGQDRGALQGAAFDPAAILLNRAGGSGCGGGGGGCRAARGGKKCEPWPRTPSPPQCLLPNWAGCP